MSKNIYLDVGQYNEDKKNTEEAIAKLMEDFAVKYQESIYIREVSVNNYAYNLYRVKILDKILET